jgi:hypothetical protein
VLIAEGKGGETDKLLVEIQNRLNTKNGGGQADALTADLRAAWLYSAGKFDELEKLAGKGRASNRRTPDRFAALVELGRLREAAEMLKPQAPGSADPYGLLILSVAWKQAGNEEQASGTRAEAVKAMAMDRPESAIAAGWLAGGRAVSVEDAQDLAMTPDRKRMLLVALAEVYPENSAGMLAAARHLNTDRTFPYHLINRLTESARAAK